MFLDGHLIYILPNRPSLLQKILTVTGILDFRRRAKETSPMKGHYKSTIIRGGFMPALVNQIKKFKKKKKP